ncbi:MAG: hypothetical protein AAFY55_18955, partial [Bacteroidota bacterium]
MEGAEDLALEVMMSRAQPSPVSAFQAYREMLFHGPVHHHLQRQVFGTFQGAAAFGTQNRRG